MTIDGNTCSFDHIRLSANSEKVNLCDLSVGFIARLVLLIMFFFIYTIVECELIHFISFHVMVQWNLPISEYFSFEFCSWIFHIWNLQSQFFCVCWDRLVTSTRWHLIMHPMYPFFKRFNWFSHVSKKKKIQFFFFGTLIFSIKYIFSSFFESHKHVLNSIQLKMVEKNFE